MGITPKMKENVLAFLHILDLLEKIWINVPYYLKFPIFIIHFADTFPQLCCLTVTWDWWLVGSEDTELVLYIWMGVAGPAVLLIVTMAAVVVVVVVAFSPARELSGLKY